MYALFCYFGHLILIPSIILRGFLELLKIFCQSWLLCGAISAFSISADASDGVVSVKSDGVNIDSNDMSVNLDVDKLNSNYIKSVDEFF